MKFSTVFVAAVAAFFCTHADAFLNDFDSMVAQIKLQAKPATALASPPHSDVCWKNWESRDLAALSCPASFEQSGDMCYSRCQPGFKGAGLFCFPDADSDRNAVASIKSYARPVIAGQCTGELVNGRCMGSCNGNEEAVGEWCIKKADCPVHLPFQCAIFCTRNATVCTSEATQLGVLFYQTIQQASAGNWVAVIGLVRRIYDRVKDWPKCHQLSSVVDGEKVVTDLLATLRNIHASQQKN